MKSKKIIATLVASLFISNMGGYLVKANPNVNDKSVVVEDRQAIIETAIPQSEMTASATSEEGRDPASSAIDGNINTMWHTKWNGSCNSKQ